MAAGEGGGERARGCGVSMAFKPIGALFRKSNQPLWYEFYVRYFIERYFRSELSTDALYCEGVRGNKAQVRVNSPLLQQEVCLMEYDVKQALREKLHYTLKEIKIIQS